MSARRFIGIGPDARGRIAPLFAPPGRVTDALSHHCAVVEALRAAPLLPAVFGSRLADNPSDLVRRIKTSELALAEALAEGRALIEMGVRLVAIGGTAALLEKPESGRGFLKLAAARMTDASGQVDRIDALIADLTSIEGVRALRRLSVADGQHVVALLVERGRAAAAAVIIENCSDATLRIEVSGPWPLYSFGLRSILEDEAA